MEEPCSNKICKFSIANLELVLDTRGTGKFLKIPPCNQKFLITPDGVSGEEESSESNIILKVKRDISFDTGSLINLLCHNEIWELWKDIQGNFVFTLVGHAAKRWIIIQPDFLAGEIIEENISSHAVGYFPLQYIEIVIYANWLANFGDVILHASGVAIDGKGYCFIGSSGAGKSTLATDLAGKAGVTILGEDQVILRYHSNQFWIFGTPWHESIDYCSPAGVPISKVFFLDRNSSQVLSHLGKFDGVVRLLQTAFIPYYRKDRLEAIIGNLDLFASQIPFYTLAYRRGSDLIKTILAA